MFQNLHLPNDYNDYQQIDYLEVDDKRESSIHESQCNMIEELDLDQEISAPYVQLLHSNH
jgi:hypothetical protein